MRIWILKCCSTIPTNPYMNHKQKATHIPDQTLENQKCERRSRRRMETDLFPGKLRCVREDEIDGELRRNRRGSRRTRLHEGIRSQGRVHVRCDFLPWLHERRIDRRRNFRWKGTSRRWFRGSGGDGSGEEARSLSKHGGDLVVMTLSSQMEIGKSLCN